MLRKREGRSPDGAAWRAKIRENVTTKPGFARSQTGTLIVIHKSLWAKNAGLLQPGGLPAISRGLSEATPPEYTKYRASTPEGSQQSDAAKKFRHSPKAVRMVLSGKWHPAPDEKDCDPSRVDDPLLTNRGCRFAQPPANSLNPYGVILSRQTAKSRSELCITKRAGAWEPANVH